MTNVLPLNLSEENDYPDVVRIQGLSHGHHSMLKGRHEDVIMVGAWSS